MPPPSTRIARPTELARAALVCMLAACTPPRDGAATRDAERQGLITEARTALGEEVRDAVPIPGSRDTLAVLVGDGQGAEPRWLVLLARAGGGWRVRSRLHTYVPVERVPDRFGAADLDADGRPEAFAVGSSWGIAEAAVEVLVAEPDGEWFRYEITQGMGHSAGAAVWSPGLEKRPALLVWMAAAAHRVIPPVRRAGDSLDTSIPMVPPGPPLTEQTALEAARQRLGWGVMEARPLDFGPYTGQNLAALYSEGNGGRSRLAVLWGGYHIYRVALEQEGVLSGGIADHADRWGVVDVDRDGKPELWEVNDASGTGAWGMGAALIDAGGGERWEAWLDGSWETTYRRRDLAPGFTGDFARKAGARAFLDSVLVAAALEAHGGEDGIPPQRRRARDAESAFSTGGAAAPPLHGPVPDAEHASCAVSDGRGTDWITRFEGGLWAHDRARDESRVVALGLRARSLVVGKRYVWTDVAWGDSAGTTPPGLMAYDTRTGRMVHFPVPELRRILQPMEFFTLQHTLYRVPPCTGACPIGLPLRAADGTLVLDDNYLTLPPEVHASDELAGARMCVTRY